MRQLRWAILVALFLLPGLASAADEPAKKVKKLLLVTHSGGFMHDSIGVAEDILKEKGKDYGFEVTCFRFTNEPEAKALEKYSNTYRARTGKTVEKENCGRINAETLKGFDAVMFLTTGNPVNKDELKDLTQWVKDGGAFAGAHCATDTQYGDAAYGDLIGAYFMTHPAGFQKIKVKVEDPKHPAAAGFEDGMPYEDEMYIFKDAPYDRDKLHIILSIDKSTFPQGKRKDGDYAISWGKEYGKGKVFYTSFGHRKEVWKDEKFQKHLFGGLTWATGGAKGDATPSGNPKN